MFKVHANNVSIHQLKNPFVKGLGRDWTYVDCSISCFYRKFQFNRVHFGTISPKVGVEWPDIRQNRQISCFWRVLTGSTFSHFLGRCQKRRQQPPLTAEKEIMFFRVKIHTSPLSQWASSSKSLRSKNLDELTGSRNNTRNNSQKPTSKLNFLVSYRIAYH